MKNKTKIIILIIIVFLIIVALLFPVFNIHKVILKKIYKLEYLDYINKYSKQNNIDPMLTAAIIKVESNFNRNIKSYSGAIGLMQLMKSTAIEEAR